MYLENLLIKTYGGEAFSSTFVVERAHRLAAKPPLAGAPLRTFIAKFLNYRDREAILRLTRERGNIRIGNLSVADFSAEVQKKRARFTEVKWQLRVHHLPYAMLFQAQLRVVSDGKAQFFKDPQAVLSWLDHLGAASPLLGPYPLCIDTMNCPELVDRFPCLTYFPFPLTSPGTVSWSYSLFI